MILHSRFGEQTMGRSWYDFIKGAVLSAPLRKLDFVEVEFHLREAFENFYGIHDHTNESKYSLSVVEEHKNGSLGAIDSGLKNRTKNFLFTGIKDLTGLNLMEWINLPRNVQLDITEACCQYKQTEYADRKKVTDEFEKIEKDLRK